jgi:hypothetical protein
MPKASESKRKSAKKPPVTARPTSGKSSPKPPQPALSQKTTAPVTALTTSSSGLRVQASLDHVAESLGGRETFLDACAQSDSEKARSFLAFYRSLPYEDQSVISLQDLCGRADMSATDLVGSMLGNLVMQSNNLALLQEGLARPDIMRASIANALGDGPDSFPERKLHFQMAGWIKGEGTQVVNLTQNVQGTGILSFEEDAHKSIASVRAEGAPSVASTQEPALFDVDGESLDNVLEDGNRETANRSPSGS